MKGSIVSNKQQNIMHHFWLTNNTQQYSIPEERISYYKISASKALDWKNNCQTRRHRWKTFSVTVSQNFRSRLLWAVPFLKEMWRHLANCRKSSIFSNFPLLPLFCVACGPHQQHPFYISQRNLGPNTSQLRQTVWPQYWSIPNRLLQRQQQ